MHTSCVHTQLPEYQHEQQQRTAKDDMIDHTAMCKGHFCHALTKHRQCASAGHEGRHEEAPKQEDPVTLGAQRTISVRDKSENEHPMNP